MRTLILGILAAALGAGCGPSAPAEPTYFRDVQPILQANCGRCHGPDPKAPQIAGFRLDRLVKNDDETLDAWDYREEILDHAVKLPLQSPPMPPDFPLSDRQRAILDRWVEQGAPKGTRDNALPSIELIAPTEVPAPVDQALDLTVRSWDDDGDGLWVQLYAREVGGGEELPLAPRFGQGRRDLSADVGVLPSGRRYEVYAALDDGFSDEPLENRTDVTLIADLLVDHGAKGTAPQVVLLEPNGGSALFGEVTIAWAASDPDPGDTLSIDLELYLLGASGWTKTKDIATGLPDSPQFYKWTPDVPDSTPTGSPIPYRIRAIARDAFGNARFDESDASFTIAPPPRTTTFTWDDTRPLFVRYCADACHGQPARSAVIEDFRLDKYDAADPVAPVNSDLGVFEMSGEIYQELIVARAMPPASQPQPTAAERELIKDWLLGGAPRTAGPPNAAPVITWSTPNDSAVSPTSGGSITLIWSAVDPEEGPVTGTVSWTQIQERTDTLATCNASLPGWTALPGVDVSAGTAVFTRPACTPTQGRTCYWCFKADASDGAKTATKVALKPVK